MVDRDCSREMGYSVRERYRWAKLRYESRLETVGAYQQLLAVRNETARCRHERCKCRTDASEGFVIVFNTGG